jgi:hypothetical protein
MQDTTLMSQQTHNGDKFGQCVDDKQDQTQSIMHTQQKQRVDYFLISPICDRVSYLKFAMNLIDFSSIWLISDSFWMRIRYHFAAGSRCSSRISSRIAICIRINRCRYNVSIFECCVNIWSTRH